VQIRKQWRDKEIFSKGKPKNDKRMLDKKVLMVEIKRKRFMDHFWSENR
jgi:hypothetical protein